MATKQQQPNDSLQRSVLPIPDRKAVGVTTYDARDPNTKFPPITPLRPPTGAPNVLVILIDDASITRSAPRSGSWSRWRGSEGRLCNAQLWKQPLVWRTRLARQD